MFKVKDISKLIDLKFAHSTLDFLNCFTQLKTVSRPPEQQNIINVCQKQLIVSLEHEATNKYETITVSVVSGHLNKPYSWTDYLNAQLSKKRKTFPAKMHFTLLLEHHRSFCHLKKPLNAQIGK